MIEVLKGLIALGEKQGKVTKANLYDNTGYGESVYVTVILEDGRRLELEGRVYQKEEE